MKEIVGAIAMVLLVVAGIVGLTWIIQGNDFFMYKVFAPKYEQVRRETFEQSKAYNEGMLQELAQMQLDYETAPKEHREVMRSLILHRVAGYDQTKLPSDLRSFIQELEGGVR